MKSIDSILNQHDIESCTLKFKMIEYSISSVMIVCNLKVYYEKKRRPFYYNEQSITLTKVLSEEFIRFFKRENIIFTTKTNNSSYINKFSVVLDSTLVSKKFKKIVGKVSMPFTEYIKHYKTLTTAEEEIYSILGNYAFEYEPITTTDLLNHI